MGVLCSKKWGSESSPKEKNAIQLSNPVIYQCGWLATSKSDYKITAAGFQSGSKLRLLQVIFHRPGGMGYRSGRRSPVSVYVRDARRRLLQELFASGVPDWSILFSLRGARKGAEFPPNILQNTSSFECSPTNFTEKPKVPPPGGDPQRNFEHVCDNTDVLL